MTNDENFKQQLQDESQKWLNEKIISQEQRDKILSLYLSSIKAEKIPDKPVSRIRASHIIIAIASVLLFTGILLFYAANWKEMSSTFKTIQVFLLVLITYGISFYCLYLKRNKTGFSQFVGRLFIPIGGAAFGIAILLIHQIYHIHSHPAADIFIWALGVLLVSIITQEKWGYYFSAGLFFIWNVWEYVSYLNPNYFFVIFPVIFFVLFYKKKAVTGLYLALFGFLYWFFQINIHHISFQDSYFSYPRAVLFVYSFIPFGILFIGTAKYLKDNAVLRYFLPVLKILGWMAVTIPFLVFSWPIDYKLKSIIFISGTLFHSIEFLIILLCAGLSFFLTFRKEEDRYLLLGILVFSLILFILPAGNKTVMMIVYHIGIPLLIFGVLWEYGIKSRKNLLDYSIAFCVTLLFLFVKVFGLMIMGIFHYKYFIAYYSGAILFSTVVFLVNEIIAYMAEKKVIPYAQKIIRSIVGFLAYILLYVLSFKITAQHIIFDADRVVLIMIFLFISISIGFYIYLYLRLKEKILVVLSSIIFITSIVMLFLASPGTPWAVYSLFFNALLVTFIGILVFYSTKIHSILLLNFVIIGFIIHLLTRYFDLIWDLLSGSVLFVISGIAGILIGLLVERKRRKLIQKMQLSQEEQK